MKLTHGWIVDGFVIGDDDEPLFRLVSLEGHPFSDDVMISLKTWFQKTVDTGELLFELPDVSMDELTFTAIPIKPTEVLVGLSEKRSIN